MCESQACPASSNLAARCKAAFLRGLELGTPRQPTLIIKLADPTRPEPFAVRGAGGGGRVRSRDPSPGKDALGELLRGGRTMGAAGGRPEPDFQLHRRRRPRARPPPTSALPARGFALALPAQPSSREPRPGPDRRFPRRRSAPASRPWAGPPSSDCDSEALPSATPVFAAAAFPLFPEYIFSTSPLFSEVVEMSHFHLNFNLLFSSGKDPPRKSKNLEGTTANPIKPLTLKYISL